MNKCHADLEQEYQREPTVEEIAERMDISSEDVVENMKIAVTPISMDAPLTEEEESISLHDVYIPTDNAQDLPEAALNNDSLKKDIERTLSVLSEREAAILNMYYGLNGCSPVSLEEIGINLGLTSERVRQVKNKSIRKLKDTDGIKRLKTYL